MFLDRGEQCSLMESWISYNWMSVICFREESYLLDWRGLKAYCSFVQEEDKIWVEIKFCTLILNYKFIRKNCYPLQVT